MINTGQLWVVATPIGHLDDLSPRARQVLAEVDYVAAEDTRHSGRLLAHLDISTPLVSLHEHNEAERVDDLLGHLQQGRQIALISDAGTPLISDPGYRLVRAARKANVPVMPVPGPCAPIAALSVAGLPSDRFFFEGFLPATQQARQERLKLLLRQSHTVICFESTHRILATAADLATLAPAHEIVVAREITKRFEEYFIGTCADLPDWIHQHAQRQRGEFVLLLAPVEEDPITQGTLGQDSQRTLEILLEELPLKQAVKLATRLTGEPRNLLYTYALAWKKST